ncbi:TPR repeat-containing protein YvcD [Lentibacillus sp. JNUCC-1]|uniref:tetratricopeptide repeat protein n=1 Tax=Lentibacillus sp. JNUCC-1 TaxID=2654513 RepID=UPI0012E8BFD4|nr:hypothetical protein [Lentibacillus sp. JNUCC-1]MUV39091.1 TPR repeat-containing protein YvcD [Lentibacillus sp. JNUCC-1]
MHVTKESESTNNNNLIPFVPEGDFYFVKGVEAFQRRKFHMALKWMSKAIEMKPHDPAYRCQKSVIYTEIGAYEKANALLVSVLHDYKERYPDVYYLMANNYAHLGLLNDARKYAETYLELEPNGDFKRETNDLLEMLDIEEADDEWDIDEDELIILQETIFYHMENNEWDEAMPLLNEMMALYPDYPLARHDYAFALFCSGLEEQAIEQEEEMLREEPGNLNSLMNLAVFYKKRHVDAYEAYIQTLLTVYPIHEQQKLRLAVTLGRVDCHEAAYVRFKSLVKSHINSPSYYRWYTRSAAALGKIEQAVELWAEGCRVHPQLKKEKVPFATL